MARTRSEEKRSLILRAAAKLIAEQGLGTPTARIAKAAGVAEGTLFLYFASKDDLLNELYLDLKLGLANGMWDGFPRNANQYARGRHIWNHYVRWGLAHPEERGALRQLGVSEKVSAASKAAAAEWFAEFAALLNDILIAHGSSANVLSFVVALFDSMAETTMHFVATHPEQADDYCNRGFDAFWHALKHQPSSKTLPQAGHDTPRELGCHLATPGKDKQ